MCISLTYDAQTKDNPYDFIILLADPANNRQSYNPQIY